jgi:acyl-CoA hydrolase
MEAKSVNDSKSIMSTLMLPLHANHIGNVHGGEIMKLMDNAAGVVAYRHARSITVTCRVDELTFHEPVHVGNVVTCYGQLTFVGKSSMEILVTVTVEDLFTEEPPKTALTAFFTFVALDEHGKPRQVAPLKISSPEEQQLFKEGQKRYELYKSRRKAPLPLPF